jgi:hypothetical protein
MTLLMWIQSGFILVTPNQHVKASDPPQYSLLCYSKRDYTAFVKAIIILDILYISFHEF